MSPEILIWSVPFGVFAMWLIVGPHSAMRFYTRLYPQRKHPQWYAHVLRAGGVALLIFMVLLLTGMLR